MRRANDENGKSIMDQINWDKKWTLQRQKTEAIQVSYKALESGTVKVGEYSAVETLRSGNGRFSIQTPVCSWSHFQSTYYY